MPSRSEEIASRSLRVILDGIPAGSTIDDSPELRKALTGLEWFLPEVLGEVHSEWKGESLDGICPHVVRKTGYSEAEILGLCWLMSDQTLTAFHLRLQISATVDEVTWLELRLGEKGQHGMVRIPHNAGSIDKRLHVLGRKIDSMEWVYKVTFGQRRFEQS